MEMLTLTIGPSKTALTLYQSRTHIRLLRLSASWCHTQYHPWEITSVNFLTIALCCFMYFGTPRSNHLLKISILCNNLNQLVIQQYSWEIGYVWAECVSRMEGTEGGGWVLFVHKLPLVTLRYGWSHISVGVSW